MSGEPADEMVAIAVLGGPQDGRADLKLLRSSFGLQVLVGGDGGYYEAGQVNGDGKPMFAYRGCEGVLDLPDRTKGKKGGQE